MQGVELKGCPFCGGKAKMGGYDAYSCDSCFTAIECSKCGAWGIPFNDKYKDEVENAINHWNTRKE